MPKSESQRPYLAFDFGAESGRAGPAHFHSGVLTTEEIQRFQNEPVEYGGALHWDVPRLWFEVRKALASVEKLELAGIGVDASRRLDLDVSPEELERRRRQWQPPVNSMKGGYQLLYVESVMQANTGVDLDFLTGGRGDDIRGSRIERLGIFRGKYRRGK